MVSGCQQAAQGSGAKSSRAVCAYCGVADPETVDHIPPKALFPRPLPDDVLTVPCCESCREGWSKDDEYFRIALLSTANLSEVPEVEPVIESILRSLSRPQARGLSNLIARSIVEIEQRTTAGIIVGTVPAFRVDRPRLERVGARIIRGLFFAELNQPLPTTHVASAVLQQFGLEKIMKVIEGVTFAPVRSHAGGNFRYTFAAVPEDPYSSLWLLDFYHRLPMVGFTLSALRNEIRRTK